jgi:MFS family permease
VVTLALDDHNRGRRRLVLRYPRRTILGFSPFIGQAFLYNAITFGYAQILGGFFHVSTDTGYYFAVIAVGNLFGPLILGPLFDTLSRKPMIAGTYILSGSLPLLTAFLFHQGMLNATTMTACWCSVLFFASAGANSAYLTVSEVFPMETRALAIAFFRAIGAAAGGITCPPAPPAPSWAVLATRGEGSVSRLLGAVSQYVLRHARCAVLVVPDARKDLRAATAPVPRIGSGQPSAEPAVTTVDP